MSIPPYDGRRNPFMPRHDVVNSDAQAAPLYPHQLTLKQSPHIKLSCRGGFPHKLKLRKRVRLYPSPYSILALASTHTSCLSKKHRLPEWPCCSTNTANPMCLRFQVNVWPFCFVAKADYSRADRAFQYGCSCRVCQHKANRSRLMLLPVAEHT